MKTEYLADGTKLLKLTPLRGVPFYSDWLKMLLDRGAAMEIRGTDSKGQPTVNIETLPIQRAVIMDDGQVGIICIGCGEPIIGELHGHTVRVSQAVLRRGGKIRKVLGAKYRVFNDLHKITIGGFVQFSEEEQRGPKEIWRRWKRKPVSMSGIGCQACRAKFDAIATAARIQNEQRELYGQLLAEITDNKARRVTPPIPDARCEKHRMQWCAACLKLSGQIKPVVVEATTTIKLPNRVTPFIDVFDHDLMGDAPQ